MKLHAWRFDSSNTPEIKTPMEFREYDFVPGVMASHVIIGEAHIYWRETSEHIVINFKINGENYCVRQTKEKTT